MTDAQIKSKALELNAAQKEFYAIWNEKLANREFGLRDYKAEQLAWRFYLAGRRSRL